MNQPGPKNCLTPTFRRSSPRFPTPSCWARWTSRYWSSSGGCIATPTSDNGHAEQAVPAGPAIGEPAPPLKLPNLKGKRVNLAAFRGKKTLVLFWNPGCGFCEQMLDDLKDFEANPPEGAPNLLVVSSGTVAENKAMGLRSTVVLDQGFSVGSAFGASGTPSAVLVDAEGKVASEVAVGAPAVLGMAGANQAEA